MIFLAPPGDEKTHLAISFAINACNHGFKVYFTTKDTLIQKLKEGATRQKAYLSSSLVIVGEFGYLAGLMNKRTFSFSLSLIVMKETQPSSRLI